LLLEDENTINIGQFETNYAGALANDWSTRTVSVYPPKKLRFVVDLNRTLNHTVGSRGPDNRNSGTAVDVENRRASREYLVALWAVLGGNGSVFVSIGTAHACQ
jgi:hypothetical protein